MNKFLMPATPMVGNEFTIKLRKQKVEEPIHIEPAPQPVFAVAATPPARPFAMPQVEHTRYHRHIRITGGILKKSAVLLIVVVCSLMLAKLHTAIISRLAVESNAASNSIGRLIAHPKQPTTIVNLSATSVPTDQVYNAVADIASQHVNFIIGTTTVMPNSSDILKWVEISGNSTSGKSTITVDKSAISAYVDQMVKQYTIAPVNQVNKTRYNGTVETTVAGVNGQSVQVPANIVTTVSNKILFAKGLSVTLPTKSIPFQDIQ